MEEDAYINDAFLEIFLNSKTTFYNTSPEQLLTACDFMETCVLKRFFTGFYQKIV